MTLYLDLDLDLSVGMAGLVRPLSTERNAVNSAREITAQEEAVRLLGRTGQMAEALRQIIAIYHDDSLTNAAAQDRTFVIASEALGDA